MKNIEERAMNDSTQALTATFGPIANLLAQSGPQLIQNRPLRKMVVKRLKRQLFEDLKRNGKIVIIYLELMTTKPRSGYPSSTHWTGL